MRFTYFYILIILIFISGCSSSHQDAPTRSQSQDPVAQDQPVQESEPLAPVPDLLSEARQWTPQFIPTGFASGIMLEFTGLKANAKLNARYSGIELARMRPDSSLPPVLKLTSTINDLRQAFFKVRPGLYLVRQTRAWAEQTVVKEVEVRDGSYSVVMFDVLNPRAPKSQTLTDSNSTR
ncbi:MAG TPA: hypothetical protein VL633_06000 [Bacteroidota bacterium]|jgi:hypothetical protein|nr:hypothetical protein [Bacteroidota bacterium]